MSLIFNYHNLKENQDQKEQIIYILLFVKKMLLKENKKRKSKIN